MSKKIFNKEVGKLPLAILRIVLLSTVYFGCIRKTGLKDYESQRKVGVSREDQVFNPKSLGLKMLKKPFCCHIIKGCN